MSFSATITASNKRKLSTPTIYYGEQPCSSCDSRAYYESDGIPMCGLHSRWLERSELPKNPDAKKSREQQLLQRRALLVQTAAENRAMGVHGLVTVSKLYMRKAPDQIPGMLNVFPNYKHQDRTDGFGCAALSPMLLGPVEHGEPGVPAAQTLENYHQFAKVFAREVDEHGNVLPAFFAARDAAYESAAPRRHKMPVARNMAGKNKNLPLFSIHVAPNGEIRRYTYLQSRYFYCHHYELLAKQKADFATLQNKLRDGENLQIVGYDGYTVSSSAWAHYNDVKRPFGHEMVLYCLLTIAEPNDYPWNQFYRLNKELYV